MHVDAYRLAGGLDEMEDLDLDVSLPESVVVVEWGEGKVEELAEDRLHVLIHRAVGDTTDEVRHVTVRGLGRAGPGPSWGRCPPERFRQAVGKVLRTRRPAWSHGIQLAVRYT